MKKILITVAVLIATFQALAGEPITAFVTNAAGCAQVSSNKYIISGTNLCNFSKFGITNVTIGAPGCGMFRGFLGWTDTGKLVAVDPSQKLRVVERQDLLWVEVPNADNTYTLSEIAPLADTILVSNVVAAKMVALKAKYNLPNTHKMAFVKIGRSISADAFEIICINPTAEESLGPVAIDSRDVWAVEGVE